ADRHRCRQPYVGGWSAIARSSRRQAIGAGAGAGACRHDRHFGCDAGGAAAVSRCSARMMAKAPDFWWRSPGAAIVLWPLAALWAAGASARMRRRPALRPPLAVICVGNYVVGG